MGDGIAADWAPERLAAWTAFVELAGRIKQVHDKEFEAEHALSLSMIGLMGRLAVAERRTLRLTDLATAMGLSLGRVSRIVDILERRGLVERGPCPSDARAINAHLTRRGLAQVRKAQATVRAAVERDFAFALDDDETAALAGALARMLARLGGGDDGADTCSGVG
ncbi:MAG TPA: MarR family transcriptional regulator [Baekduia sp.]|uniref:MarR family winged helix-turn-helix transcriptional regulator n=1 Tax=Baekduia sp. TaxID=2600305 RepID=UPI002D77F71E|nr:MarR family transcriptional regulator [Baekduia sp.]HET6509049.1 MarR family transcriptional regulator [Baekduia sp.]